MRTTALKALTMTTALREVLTMMTTAPMALMTTTSPKEVLTMVTTAPKVLIRTTALRKVLVRMRGTIPSLVKIPGSPQPMGGSSCVLPSL